MIKAHLISDVIYSTSPEAYGLYEKSRLGEKKMRRVEYSYFEALYLVSAGKMEVLVNGKVLGEETLIKKLKRKDPKIETKFAVFSDLRSKGYIVKTALKFGAEFRVYEKGVSPGEDHATWILFTSRESERFTWHDFAAKNRVAHSTKKNLLLGIVDDEGDITYYEVRWIRT